MGNVVQMTQSKTF
jgi:translation initiation factor eIF-2B subunit alpha